MTTAVKDKREELEALVKQMHDLAPEGKLKPEDRETFDELNTKAGSMREEIADELADEARVKSIASAQDFLDKPQNRIPHGAQNGDDDAKKSLMRAGWEVKNGIIHAPTSLGKTVAMFPANVLIDDEEGTEEMGSDARAYVKSVRATFSPDYSKTYNKWLKNAIRSRDTSIGFSMLNDAEQKLILNALSENTDTAGGFTVPPDVQAEMLVRLGDKSVMRQNARVQPTIRDMLVWPRVQGKAVDGSIFSSAFVGDWVGETPTQADIDAVFGQFQIPIHKARAKTTISNDLIADSAVNILAWLAENGSQNLSLVEDKQFIVGPTAGPALQPKGVANSGATAVPVAGSVANTISNSTAAVGSAPLILDLMYALPPQYRATAKVLLSPQVEKAIRKLVDAQGRFMYLGTSAGGFSARPGEMNLEGFPTMSSQFMPDNTALANDKKIIFGEFSAYIIAVRQQMSVAVLRERVADTDQTMIIIFDRVGGDTWNEDAFRIATT